MFKFNILQPDIKMQSTVLFHRGLQRALISVRFFVAVLLCTCAGLAADSISQTHWVASWATSQQLVEPHNSLAPEDLHDSTVRQIIHPSLAGSQMRLRLSNRYGEAPLHITTVHVARAAAPGSDKIDPATDKVLTFSGSQDVSIPPHADYVSDPVSFAIEAQSDIAITLHIDAAPPEQTGHPGSRTTSYVLHGDSVSAPEMPGAKKLDHWYYIAGIAVPATADASAIVALGDSITDGRGSTTNGNDRWTDDLARLLQKSPATKNIAVLNAGIGGNHILTDGIGPSALSRFDADVIVPPGVRYLIVFEGVNDLGLWSRMGEISRADHEALVHHMIAAYQQMILRAHAHNIKAIGATITAFVGGEYYHPGPANEADRQVVNEWIRTPGHFDAVVDFDKATRDPEHPDRLLPAYDTGDHLHLTPAGYVAMAEAVPLSLFSQSSEPAPQIAFTFDDLPAHGSLPPGETRMEVISKITAALHDAHMPPIYGFVNGVDTEQHPEDVEVLKAWHSAGNPLGNHSWSHMNLNQHSLEEYEQDVKKDEPLIAGIMKKGEWHWYRYPFLAEGDTPEKKEGFRNFLRQRGYKVAAVTMSFGDYMWTEPYARCKAKGDQAAITTLQNTYLQSAEESIAWYRELSHTLYQRDIPYVLLMHVGALDAEMMPRLLQLYRDKGFQFVTLPEAESDEFYRDDTNLSLPAGPEMLESAMSARHLPLPPRTNFGAQLDSMCK